ncbi:hypothetical protein BD408DRAFT_425455 [Parasitella parasitica]|nr:hypothetical protein BD408DRAFT_425455 [Parasitella parasitica]
MLTYVKSPRLFQVLRELHGEGYVLFKKKANYKLKGGGGFPPHQDAGAFCFGKSSDMAEVFTIDPTTETNGCLEVVLGYHKNDYDGRLFPSKRMGVCLL